LSKTQLQKKTTKFSIPKIGEDEEQNKDSVNYSDEFNRFALSDGVSGSSYSKEWADLLTKGFVEKPFMKENFDLKSWITPLQITWYNAIPWETLEDPTKHPHYVAEKAREGGSATFVGGYFEEIDQKIFLKTWALGDSNLFLVREGQNILSFPLTTSEEFGIDPDMFFSLPKDIENSTETRTYVGEIKYKEIEILENDLIICASDSISKWYIDSLDNPAILPWMELEQIFSIDDFKNFISDKVKCKNLKNDDSSIIVMRF
jgi:hypothetical protein